MIKLSQLEMLELLPANESLLIRAHELFYKLFPKCQGWLEYGIKEGFLHCNQVNWDGQPYFYVWYELAADGRFIVHAAQALKAVPALEVLQVAIQKLMKQHKRTFAEFRTCRRGLVRQLVKLGCKVDSIVLTYAPEFH